MSFVDMGTKADGARSARRLYSFDVFDTVLVRTVALPTDIFRLVGRDIVPADIQPEAANTFVEDFVSARIAAENLARERALPCEDCALEAIWKELHGLLPNLPENAGPQTEIRIERENIVANPHLSGRIASLRQAGERIVFVSDIFHSRRTVFDLLTREGLAESIEEVFVSSDAGLLKSSGRLFVHVGEATGTPLRDILHQGDHPISDGSAARRLGVRTRAYTATRLNAAEQAVMAAFGSDLAGSRLAAAMRLSRLRDGNDGRASLVSALLGPLTLLLASWALREAEDGKAERLYFVARDGHMPWCAAIIMAKAYPQIECRYVKLSRNAIAAALPALGEFGASWIARSWSGLGIREIAERLGHSWDVVAPRVAKVLPRAGADHRLTDGDEIRRFVAVLDEAPMDERRKERRRAVLHYLREEGILTGKPFMIFDVGWYLNLQAALTALLADQGVDGFRGGLYLGLRVGRVTERHAGASKALVYEKPFAPDLPGNANSVFDRMILVEHLLGLAPHGSAKGYEINGSDQPLVVEGPISERRKVAVARISHEVGAFAALLAPHTRAFSDPMAIARAVEALTAQVMTAPDAYDLAVLGEIEREDDSQSGPAMAITEPWRVKTALCQAIPYRLRAQLGLSHGPTLWPEASLARTGTIGRGTLSLVRRLRRSAGQLTRQLRT